MQLCTHLTGKLYLLCAEAREVVITSGNVKEMEPLKICLILEGCYPYVFGGVSTWMHQYINQYEGARICAVGDWSQMRKDRGKFVYELPPQVNELCTRSFWMMRLQVKASEKNAASFFQRRRRTACSELMLCGRPGLGGVCFRLYQEKRAESDGISAK